MQTMILDMLHAQMKTVKMPFALSDAAARSLLAKTLTQPLFPGSHSGLELKMAAYLCFYSVSMQHSPSCGLHVLSSYHQSLNVL